MENISDSKLLPYGMMNFAVIRRDDYYYVDKTAFIPLIERSDRFFFFMRPRRFGKSLTLNMLQHYYDIAAKDKFDALLRCECQGQVRCTLWRFVYRAASHQRPE